MKGARRLLNGLLAVTFCDEAAKDRLANSLELCTAVGEGLAIKTTTFDVVVFRFSSNIKELSPKERVS